MVTLKVTQVRKFNEYVLHDEKTNFTYNFVLEFQDVDAPKYGDVLLFNEDLLNPQSECYSHSYSFGAIDSPYGKSKAKIDPKELIGLHTTKDNIILKRIYG